MKRTSTITVRPILGIDMAASVVVLDDVKLEHLTIGEHT
jgi:hypothetical protein